MRNKEGDADLHIAVSTSRRPLLLSLYSQHDLTLPHAGSVRCALRQFSESSLMAPSLPSSVIEKLYGCPQDSTTVLCGCMIIVLPKRAC